MTENTFTVTELTELLGRYAIGKKPLATLLGWGETTILRYCEGITPAGEFAGKLRTLYDCPAEYLKLLEENKDRITSVAYKKSKNAVLFCLTPTKTMSAAYYLMRQAEGDCAPYQIVLTLYYAQAAALGLGIGVLFEEDCELTTDGMLPYGEVYEQLKKSGTIPVTSSDGMLTETEQKILDGAAQLLSWFGKEELRNVFASEQSYLRRIKTTNGGKKIKNADMASYFKKVVEGYRIEKNDDFFFYFLDRSGRPKNKNVHKTRK